MIRAVIHQLSNCNLAEDGSKLPACSGDAVAGTSVAGWEGFGGDLGVHQYWPGFSWRVANSQ